MASLQQGSHLIGKRAHDPRATMHGQRCNQIVKQDELDLFPGELREEPLYMFPKLTDLAIDQ